MATATRRRRRNNGGLELSWEGFNHALTTLEKGAGWVFSRFKHSIPQPWSKRINQLSYKDIMKLAVRKKNRITREVRYYADGIVKTLNRADILPNKNRLVKEARQSLKSFLNKVQKSNVAHQAKHLAKANGSKLLSLLDFPSKREVAKLNARLNQLEKRFKVLGRTEPTQPAQ